MPQQQAYDLQDIDSLAHPAAVAWQSAAGPAARAPLNIAVLQEKSRGGVYRLDGAAPDDGAVIAKRSKHGKNVVEWKIYSQILPDLPVKSVRCYGLLEPADADGNSWIFLSVAEAAGAYSPFDPRHRVLAARWLALLHTTAAPLAAKLELPDRSDANYLALLRAARQTMIESFDNTALNPQQREVVTRCMATCDRAESHWDHVDRACGVAPLTLVHGDFAAKNMRVCHAADGTPEAIVPYDWGQAGFGVPAADLAQPLVPNERYWVSPDLETYRDAVRTTWPDLELSHWRALGHVGRIFRALVCLNGDAKSLHTPWVERVIHKIDAYRQQIDDAMREAGWSRRGHGKVRGRRHPSVPDEATLADGLSRMMNEPVSIVSREANPCASTFASEFVICRTAGTRELKLFCKYGEADIDTCFGHRGDVAYEAQVYRQVLSRTTAPTPRFYGSLNDDAGAWLALERVAESQRLSDLIDPAETLRRAAQLIGAFHAASAAGPVWQDCDPPLIRHDADYLLGWVHRTRLFSARLRDRYPWIETLCRRGEQLFQPLIANTPVLIHGELYPHNLLISDERLVIIDWQSAAIASGAVDLAALVENWPAEIVRQAEEAYRAARWPGGAPADFDAVLHAARLHLHFRWLGDRPKWTLAPEAERRFEQLRRAGEQAGIL